MPETNSANPSDPDPDSSLKPSFGEEPGEDTPGSGGDPGSAPKLRLKQILTPLSPHLKPEERKQESEEAYRPPRKRLQVPRAEPVDEEEEDPVQAPPGPKLTAPPDPGIEDPLPVPPAPEIGEEELEEEEPPGEPAPKVPARRPSGPGMVQRVARVMAPVLLVAALLFTANHFFDPFGIRKDPESSRPEAVEGAPDSDSGSRLQRLEIDPADLERKLEQLSVESYLERLARQQVHPARHPDGLFIGAAFVPVGSRLNPELGLTLKAVGESRAIVEDEFSQEYPIYLSKSDH